jgi:hypothetical protein
VCGEGFGTSGASGRDVDSANTFAAFCHENLHLLLLKASSFAACLVSPKNTNNSPGFLFLPLYPPCRIREHTGRESGSVTHEESQALDHAPFPVAQHEVTSAREDDRFHNTTLTDSEVPDMFLSAVKSGQNNLHAAKVLLLQFA